MCQSQIKRTPDEHLSETDMMLFLESALNKKRAVKRRRPDMYREALLQQTVQRLNDEIIERSRRRTKKRKFEEKYEWQSGPNGWLMSDKQDNEEIDNLLGINSFFSELSNTKKIKQRQEELNKSNCCVLPSFKETFGQSRSDDVHSSKEEKSPSYLVNCRAEMFKRPISLVEKFDALYC